VRVEVLVAHAQARVTLRQRRGGFAAAEAVAVFERLGPRDAVAVAVALQAERAADL
jgi:hypothetical protein